MPLEGSTAEKGLVAHYSKDFAVAYHDAGIVMLKRFVTGGLAEEKIVLDASESSEKDARRAAEMAVAMFGRLDEKDGASYAHVDYRRANCLGQPGIETTASVERRFAETLRFRACTVLRGGMRYQLAYWLPARLAAEDEAEVRRIVDATELVVAPIEDAAAAAAPSPGPSQGTASSGVERVVAGLRPAFKSCYQRGLAKDPSLAGSTTIVTKVEPDGRVGASSPRGTAGLGDEVTACLAGVVGGARFDPSPAGATLEIPVRFEQRRP